MVLLISSTLILGSHRIRVFQRRRVPSRSRRTGRTWIVNLICFALVGSCFLALRLESGTEINVSAAAEQQAVQVVCDKATKQAMIKAREQFLTERTKSRPHQEQPKLRPGHIGPTRATATGDEKQSDMEQTVVQPGATFPAASRAG
jgi:3,4-dihydroxy-2-butanone 4-phosphate synthase